MNIESAKAKALRRTLSRDRPAATRAVLRAILTRSVVAIPDVLEDPEYVIGERSPVAADFRSVLAVP